MTSKATTARKPRVKAAVPTRYVPRAEAAEILGCSTRHMERLAKAGSGPPYRLNGNRAVYPLDELDAWARAQMNQPGSAPAPAVAA